jgi:glycosyltransferase involved in cell wall biosynthesis
MQSATLSVVVPTHRRADLLEKLLISLKKAYSKCNTLPEVILIDDSAGEQRNRIEKLSVRFGAIYLRGPSSVREKRNMGIERSSGQIILFIDSDCEVSEDIFIEHMRMYNEPDTGGVFGITEFVGEENYAWRIAKRTNLLDVCSFAKTLSRYLDSAPWVGANNLSVRKEILEKIGGFDTSFPFLLGGDDTDLGIRINKAGYKIRMNPQAIVFHSRETWRSLTSIAKRAFRWGRMDYYIYYRKHKEKLSLSSIKPVAFLFLLMPIGFTKSFVSHSYGAAFLPLFWLVVFMLLNSIFKLASSTESIKTLPLELPAQFLEFLFNFGTAFESLKNASLSVFFKAPLSDPRQIVLLWDRKVRETWSLILSILMVILFLAVI